MTSVSGAGAFADDPQVRLVLGAEVGDVVPEQRNSIDRDGFGSYVVAFGADETDAVERCERVLEAVSIVTSPLPAVSMP